MQDRGRSARSVLGAGLFVVVVLCLLTPIGLIVRAALADPITGGSNPPGATIAPDPVSDSVGATAAEFRVDESGSATYAIQLYTVPGTAGIAPKLSLNYSSQDGDGPLGRGWSIGGLSSISRCRATREAGDFIANGVPVDDGAPRPINFGATDRYCLDGQRLIPAVLNNDACAAVSGMTVQNLRAEIDAFQRVCAYAPSGGTNGPSFFTVERKDGSISWYGDRDNSTTQNRADGYVNTTSSINPDAAIAWAQTRMQDASGNYVDFLYDENPNGAGQGEHLLKQVNFTGKTVLAGQNGSASAPYAKLVFNYVVRAAGRVGKGYASGGLMVQSRRLDSITSCATIACASADQARFYQLSYAPSPSGSGLDTLISLQECRDGTKAVCLPATTFAWSQGKYEFATAEYPPNLQAGSLENFRGYKLADVDGDGRLDIVYLKDGSGTCGTEYLIVFFSTLDAGGNPYFAYQPGVCLPAAVAYSGGPGDGAWQLFDYNGDGRDDLFIQGGGSAWAVYPALGRNGGGVAFNLAQNLVAGLSPAIPKYLTQNDQPQLADLNGDGLTDIVYPSGSVLRARLMERQGGTFGWGAERSVVVDTSGLPPLSSDCGDLWTCTRTVGGVPTTKTGFTQTIDFNGDASSDLAFSVTTRMEMECQAALAAGSDAASENGEPSDADESWESMPYEYTGPSDDPPAGRGDPVTDSVPECNFYNTVRKDTYAFAIKSITSTTIGLGVYGMTVTGATTYYPPYTGHPAPYDSPFAINYVDANGDGLSDVFYRTSNASDWSYALNTGTGFLPPVAVPMQDFLDQVRFADVNGDGRTDILHLINTTADKRYNVRYAQPDGSYGTEASLPGGNAIFCDGSSCDPAIKSPMFADFDGDGNLDFLSLKYGSDPDLYLSRASSAGRYAPRDVVVQITNGLGSVTQIAYAPMTNEAVYLRDTGSRDEKVWGRGSAVSDVLMPRYVVARASSSSPQAGAPAAMASVHYRYAGAKAQAGGRGFLGFRQIVTFDANHAVGYVTTETNYAQEFPFVGTPLTTVKREVASGSYVAPACLTGAMTEACFSTPGQVYSGVPGNYFSSKAQVWESDRDVAGTATVAFAAGVQAPVQVRTLGTEETLRDPFTGTVTSKAETDFAYGAYGNVVTATVATYAGTATTPIATITTASSYGDTPASWRLGRMTASTVTHSRPNRSDVVRRSGFSYAPGTGLLSQERTGASTNNNEESLKVYGIDAYGNHVSEATCAAPAATAACAIASMNFHPADTAAVARYRRVNYDALGRYPVSTVEPFWNGGTGSGITEQTTQTVLSRDVFGNVVDATDVNGVQTTAIAGKLGRPYYAWMQTAPGTSIGDTTAGLYTLTTYRWCGAGTNQVTCPAGAKFREQVLATEAASHWTYFDALGRPILKIGETFNDGVAGKDLAGVCTTYDAGGRPSATSNPFFLAGVEGSYGPTVPSTQCTGASDWTTTTYDVLGRPTVVTAPDSSTVQTAYVNSQLRITDPRGNVTVQSRSAKGELSVVTDANGLQTIYGYYADGTLYYVSRDAGRGAVANSFVYDSSGRKIQQNDPDAGTTQFFYNALGEVIAQVDGDGDRIDHWHDGRGRVWKSVTQRHNADDTFTVETQSLRTYDTAANGLGELALESASGTYLGWVGQAGTALDFSRSYSYDAMGRALGSVTTIDGTAYPTAAVYDDRGRVWKVQDASGRWARTEFTMRGAARAVCNSSATDTASACPFDSNTYLATLETDAWGHVVRERRGNSASMDVNRTYWADTGRLSGICAGTAAGCGLVNEGYGWDAAGNLSTQQKENRYLETFTYDSLNRLKTGTLMMQDGVTVNQVAQRFEYDALGNLCRRETLGTTPRDYTYDGRAGCGLGDAKNSAYGSGGTSSVASPHQVSDLVSGSDHIQAYYDTHGNGTTRLATAANGNVSVKYSLDDRAYEMTSNAGGSTRFWYGSDGSRYKRVDGGRKTLYLGNVEVEIVGGTTTFKRTVAGVMLQTSATASGAATNYYLFHDQLGSLVRITNAAGAVVNRLDFVAYGGRRDVDTQAANAAPPSLTTRGFTGHEMVETAGVNLIHMNGRIYDPTIGRFLQPDPVIQAPDNPQSWNAYTYVFNNPLAYTDPTGMLGTKERQGLAIIVAIVAACFQQYYISHGALTAAFAVSVAGGFAAGAIASNSLKGGLIGAFGAALTFGVSSYVATEYQVLAQAVSGGIMESLQGGNFGHGFIAAGLTASVMPQVGQITNDVERVLTGALVGGTLSAVTGGNFANGAVSGAIQAAMSGIENSDGNGNPDASSISDQVDINRDWWRSGAVKTTNVDGVEVVTGRFIYDSSSDQSSVDYLVDDVNNNLNKSISNGKQRIRLDFSFKSAENGEIANIYVGKCNATNCMVKGINRAGIGVIGNGSMRINREGIRRSGTGSHELMHNLGFWHSRNSTGGITSYARIRGLTYDEAYRLQMAYQPNDW